MEVIQWPIIMVSNRCLRWGSCDSHPLSCIFPRSGRDENEHLYFKCELKKVKCFICSHNGVSGGHLFPGLTHDTNKSTFIRKSFWMLFLKILPLLFIFIEFSIRMKWSLSLQWHSVRRKLHDLHQWSKTL